MNSKSRSLRAGIALVSFVFVIFINADAFAHVRAGAEYRHDISLGVTLIGGAVTVALFTWNAVEYARKRY